MTSLQRTLQLVKGLVTLIGTLVFVVAIPVGLVRVVGWPLPTRLPTLDEVALGLRSSLDPNLVIKTIAVIVWIAWLQLVIALTAETIAHIRGGAASAIRTLPGFRLAAARVVATVALCLSALGPMRQPAMAFATPIPAAAEVVPASTPALSARSDRLAAPGTDPAVSRAARSTNVAEVEHPTYTTRRFDTLWSIAETTLGDGTRWRDIRDLNAGRTMVDGTEFTHGTEHIEPGWTLHLPYDATITVDSEQPAEARTVLVEPGDSFWSIANAALTDAWARRPTTDEALDYGARLVETNRPRLKPPHDPDLIFPGQTFELPDIPPPESAGTPPNVDDTPGTVTVDPGDHFWGVAEDTLEAAWGRDADDSEIAGYWRSLIDLNRDRLRPPHDPNLIHPGQTFHLPDIPEDPHSPTAADADGTGGGNPPPDLATDTTTPDPSTGPADTTVPSIVTPSEATPDTVLSAPIPTSSLEAGSDARADLDAGDDSDHEWVDEADDEATGTWLPTAARIAGLGVLAAGTVAVLDRLRRIQIRKRRPGTHPTPPPPQTRPVETTLRTANAHTAVDLLNLALRSLGAAITHHHLRAPDIAAVRIAPEGIQLLLRQPHTDPPAGWQPHDDGRSWLLPANIAPATLHTTAGSPAPWPVLVTVGHHHNTEILLNLEHPGSLQVTGDPDEVHDTMVTMAIQLASSPLADDMQIYCIGFGADLGHFERVYPVDDLDQALDWIDVIARDATTQTDDPAPLDRLQPGGDIWSPIVVLDPNPEPPANANRLLVHANSRTPITAVVAYPTGQRWQLHIHDDTAHLDPINLTLDRRNLTPDEQAGVAQLTSTAKDLDGIPAPSTNDHSHRQSPGADPTTLTTQPDPEAEPVADNGAPPAANIEDTIPYEPRLFEVPTSGANGSAVPMVRVLGNVRIDNLPGDFPRSRCRDVVVYLALHRNGVDADALTEALWPNQPPVEGRLTRYLSNARTTLGKAPDDTPYIPRIGKDGLCRVHPAITTDLNQFESHLTDARTADTPEEKAPHLRAALELVEGPPFSGGQHDGYTWAHTEGAASHATITIDEAAHQLAQHALDTDDPDTATWAARKGILVTRICEHCYRNLMTAAIATNNPIALEAVYRQLIANLEIDEGADATDYLEPETVELYSGSLSMQTG